MSEMAKSARAKMKDKAKRLADGDPHAKVDSSSWTPPEMMNTEAKTGLRPISRRAYKKGGKVGMKAEGETCAPRADRKARKDGGRSGSKPISADTLVTRDVKEGNAAERGKPHTGGYKHGGRSKKMDGGVLGDYPRIPLRNMPAYQTPPAQVRPAPGLTRAEFDAMMNARKAAEDRIAKFGSTPEERRKIVGGEGRYPVITTARKKGGKVKDGDCYARGGYATKGATPKATETEAEAAENYANKISKRSRGIMDEGSPKPKMSVERFDEEAFDKHRPAIMQKAYDAWRAKKAALAEENKPKTSGFGVHFSARGGRADPHEDVAADKALIRKMVKAEARTGKAKGGGNYTGGTRPTGGRIARKDGGKTGKGKTNINIIIGRGQAAPSPMMGAAPMPPQPARPVPMPPPPPAGGMPPVGAGAPMGMPPMPPGGPMGAPPPGPLMRKAGGRTYRSYKDMDAGAGSGLGRLEKTEIQKRKR